MYIFFIVIHIVAGSLGLLSGTVASIAAKGKKIHKISGTIFFYSMLVTSISAMITANLPNHNNVFLFAVGGFTFYMITSGYRIIFLNRSQKNNSMPIGFIDYCITFFWFLFGIYLLYVSLNFYLSFKNLFAIVPAVFGLISIGFAALDSRILFGKKSIATVWIGTHITRMMGSLIAAYTAFLVVNIQIQQGWILWLLPTIIGSLVISFFMKKYVHKKMAVAKSV